MKESKMSVNEQVFHALIFAHSKLGEFEAADNIKDIMNDIGLGVGMISHKKSLITIFWSQA